MKEEKMKEWLKAVNEILEYFDENPKKDNYECDSGCTLRDTLQLIKDNIEVWILECNEKKNLVRMIRGSQPDMKDRSLRYLTELGVGHYVGGFVDEWRWENEDSKVWDLPLRNLAIIYRWYCKQ